MNVDFDDNLYDNDSEEGTDTKVSDKTTEDGGEKEEKKFKDTTVFKLMKYSFRTFSVLTALFLTLGVVSGFVFVNGVSKAELPDKPNELQDASPVRILAADGVTEISKIYPENGTRKIVSSEEIPLVMKNALVSAEDSSFWDNPGFSIKRIAAAALGHAQGNEDAGGASTITQQLIKNTVVGDEISLERKWKEVLSSTRLTSAWDKDDIITAYLNTVYFGRGATGIENASKAYFDIPAAQLNSAQAAFLAGVIQSPSAHDPAIDKQGSMARFDYVVGEMKRHGYIPQEEEVVFPETIEPKPANQSSGLLDSNGLIATMVLNELKDKNISMSDLHLSGSTIITTIDPKVNQVVSDNARGQAQANGIRVSAVATDPKTGGIKGIYGGDDGQGFNYATEPQMTGSTFKVVTLAAALENGINLDTKIDSSPYTADGIVLNNSEGMSCGTCSLAEATKQSLNTSFYRLQDMLPEGPHTTRDMAHKLGIEASLEDKGGFVAKSITLGSYGTSMADMSHAMATIANNGVRNDQHIIDHINTRNDNTVYKVNTHPSQVISGNTAQQIDRALEPIPAYSNGNQLSGKTGYGKTGTVQLGDTGQNRDASMVGYTDNMALAVWAGTDDGSPLTDARGAMVWGAGIPATTWKNILNEVG